MKNKGFELIIGKDGKKRIVWGGHELIGEVKREHEIKDESVVISHDKQTNKQDRV